MIITKTPLRISFFGGGTDYPEYFNEFGGCVLSTTINKYVYVITNPIGGLLDDKYRIAYRKLEQCNSIDEIEHPSAREVLRHLSIHDGLDINIISDLPARTGLGSSSSFTVGLLHNLYAFKGLSKSKMEYAQEAIYVEKEILKENVGVQDQLAAAFGGFNYMHFSEQGLRVEPLQISDARKLALEKNLMLFYTGINRFATEVLKEQIQNTKEKKINTELKDIYNMVQQGMSILSDESNQLDDFGRLMHEAWMAKRSLSTAISNETLDNIYNKAMSAGAIGGKLLGAGGGGFFLFYVPQENQDAVKTALSHLHQIDIQFENQGSQIIFAT
jgi:D-glycero-alpha-D-manno-heptose-7-phosphate kinase